MFALVLAIVLAAVGFVLLRLKDHPRKLSRYAAIPFALAFFLVASASYYRLDAGEAAVTKTFGTVGDEAISATGIHLKAPWQDLIRFDIRNQTIALDEGGGRISTVTSDNATVAYDVTIRYSLNPGKLSRDRAAVPRPGVVHLPCGAARCLVGDPRRADDLHGRDGPPVTRRQLALRITEGLEKRLGEVGVTVEQVDPRAITLDQSVQANYDKVQSSLANAEAAKADLQTALAKAEITKTEAQATSDADQIIRCGATSTQVNEVINGKDVKAVKVVPVPSEKCQNRLNEQVLMSKYIDMLKEHGDSLIVVPQGTSNLLQLPTRPVATPKTP